MAGRGGAPAPPPNGAATPGGGPAGALPRIGVLAVQGDFQAHIDALSGRANAWPVRSPEDLERHGGIDGLVLPGGESTTMLRLLRLGGLWEPLGEMGRRGLPMFGTCAGAILLARKVVGPPGGTQESLGILNATVLRNAYGRQAESFETEVTCNLFPGVPLPVVCIRAPRFLEVGPEVEVLAAREGEPLWVRQGPVWAATFHPELTGDPRVHEAFVADVALRLGAG